MVIENPGIPNTSDQSVGDVPPDFNPNWDIGDSEDHDSVRIERSNKDVEKRK